jgi:hypothetical protein
MEADRDFFRRVRRDHSLPLPQTSAAGPNPHMFRQRSFGAPLSVGSSTRGSIPSVRWPMSPMASRKGDEDADSQVSHASMPMRNVMMMMFIGAETSDPANFCGESLR